MKIAYFALSEEYGAKHAGFTHAYNIAKTLSEAGVDIELFFKHDEIGIIKQEKNLVVHGVIFPSLSTLKQLKISDWIKSYNYIQKKIKDCGILYERMHINPLDLLFVKKKRYILEINDPTYLLYSGIKKIIYKKLVNKKIKKCEIVITQTETLKNILGKFINKPIHIVQNGVDTEKFKPEIKNNIRKKYNIKNNEQLILFAGAFMQWHGVQEIPSMAENIPEAKFMLVGNGPLYEEIKAKTAKNMILTGSVEHTKIAEYLSASDILIAPFNTKRFTKLEDYGFWWCPIKLYEYMASGKPIISYNYDEVKNIVKDCALLAEPGNIKQLEENIKTLINNKELSISLGKKARGISLGCSWEKRAEQLKNILTKI